MQTALSHLIGTTAALGIMSAMIAASFQISAYQRINIAKRELQEVTDYIAQNMYDLIQTANFSSTVKFTGTSNIALKQVDVPISADGKTYSIALIDDNGSISVSAWVDGQENIIKVGSILPVNSPNAMIKVNANDGEVIAWIDLGGQHYDVIVKAKLTSGYHLPVIWIKITSGGIFIGLGFMEKKV